MIEVIDWLGEAVLIYEGVVLLCRRLRVPVVRNLPVVTDIIRRARRLPFGWLAPSAIEVWLWIHFRERVTSARSSNGLL